MNQKEAVFKAVTNVKGTDDFQGEPVKLSDEEREKVKKQVFDLFKAGEVGYNGTMPADKDLMTYVTGLLSNWLRKDKRLNGGTDYVPKQPGIRQGNGDEQLKAMKILLSQTTDPDDRKMIQEAIDARIAVLKPKKEVNIDALPPHLRELAAKLIPQE